MGRWDDGKGGLAHREGIRQEHRSGELRRAICDGPMLGSYATEASWSRSNFFLGHVSVQTTELYLGCKQRIRSAVNDRIGIEPNP